MSASLRLAAAVALLVGFGQPVTAQSGALGNSIVIDDASIIVGEPNNSFRPGMVYVYERDGSTWAARQVVTAPDSERADGFGALLALSDERLFVAGRSGDLHEYVRSASGWAYEETLPTGELETLDPRCDFNGYCGVDFGLSLAAHGDWVFLGQAGVTTDLTRLRPRGRSATEEAEASPPGRVLAFHRGADGSWTLTQSLESPASADGDAFGAAVAFAGGRALVGAPRATSADGALEGAGRVFEYELVGMEWRPAGELETTPEAEASYGAVITSRDARALVGAPFAGLGHGAVYNFEHDGSRWTLDGRLEAPGAAEGDIFGAAIGFEGSDVWVGAPVTRGLETGMAFHFSNGAVNRHRFTEAETNTEDSYGHRIAVEGGLAAVAAAGLDHQAGGVFVYERDPRGEWHHTDLLVTAPDAMGALTGQERRCMDGSVENFDCTDIELLAYIPISLLTAPEDARGVRANDNWGWTDPETGHEYALVGRNDGTSFIDISDPSNPRLIGDLPKTANTPRSQLWRDIKTFGNHAYIVADGAGAHGMQIFDLTRLRDVDTPPVIFEPDVLYRGEGLNVVESSHNVIINEDTGFAYLTSRGCAGMHMVDINEPTNPRFVGCSDPGGTHDAQCVIYNGPDEDYVGREICLRMSGNRFQISDVTDKTNPVELSTATHPNPAYMHQGWVTEDHRYFIMDDESDVIAGNVETTRTLIWDLDDLEDPVLAREFFGSLPASAHNLYVKGDFTYQANYNYGLHILDTSDPLNPVEVGMFDTAPYRTGAGFGGAWSTYPFFESGTILVTSMQEGLFMLKKRVRPVS